MRVEKTRTEVDERIDAASITARVKMTLQYHHSISALDAKVEMKHDVVALLW